MVNDLLANLVKSGVLGQIGDVAMHLSIHLDVFHHVFAVGLESTVEVVQVLDTADFSCCGIEQLGGDGLRQRVVTFLLVAGH